MKGLFIYLFICFYFSILQMQVTIENPRWKIIARVRIHKKRSRNKQFFPKTQTWFMYISNLNGLWA